MGYKEKDFKHCSFNPLVNGSMIDNYPRIAEIVEPEWVTSPELDSLIRYIILVYDPKSPMVKNEKDLNYRKGVAAEMAGFNMEDERDLVNSIFDCTHEYFVDLIIKFLIRFAKSKEFAAIIVVENCFWESAKELMKPITGDNSKQVLEAVQKKSAIKAELDIDIGRLEKYYKSFFGEDLDLETKAKTKFTPESFGTSITQTNV